MNAYFICSRIIEKLKMNTMHWFMTACYLTRLLRLVESYECVESETSVQTTFIGFLNIHTIRWRKIRKSTITKRLCLHFAVVLICSLTHSFTQCCCCCCFLLWLYTTYSSANVCEQRIRFYPDINNNSGNAKLKIMHTIDFTY